MPSPACRMRAASPASWTFIPNSSRFSSTCTCPCGCRSPPITPNDSDRAAAAEHHRRDQRVQRPLAGRQPVRVRAGRATNRLPRLCSATPGAGRHDAGSERLEQRLDQRDRVALAVDRGQVDRVAGACRDARGSCRAPAFVETARLHVRGRPPRVDLRAPRPRVLLRDERREHVRRRRAPASASRASRSANAIRLASASRWRQAALLWPSARRSSRSRMFSISRTTKPWVFGGSSHDLAAAEAWCGSAPPTRPRTPRSRLRRRARPRPPGTGRSRAPARPR